MKYVLLLCLIAPACKKESTNALPPAKEWQAAGSPGGQPPGGAPPSSPGPVAPGHGGALPPGHPPLESPSAPPPAAGLPPGHPPMPAHGGAADPSVAEPRAPTTLEKLPDGRLVLGPFTMVAPKEWTAKPVTSSMRAAQFELSNAPGTEAELVVFHFGQGGAGGVQANLDRWIGQFVQSDGKPSKDVAKIETTKFAGQAATTVSVTGRYVTTAMGNMPAVDKADQMMLGAIIESPMGAYYFKLVGAKRTVEQHAARFRALLASLRLK